MQRLRPWPRPTGVDCPSDGDNTDVDDNGVVDVDDVLEVITGWSCQLDLPTGACCVPDGGCLVETALGCTIQDGYYMGDGIDCADEPCSEYVTVPGEPNISTGTLVGGNATSLVASDNDRVRVGSELNNDQQRTSTRVTMATDATSAFRLDLAVEITANSAGILGTIRLRNHVAGTWDTLLGNFPLSQDDRIVALEVTKNAADYVEGGIVQVRLLTQHPDTVHTVKFDLLAVVINGSGPPVPMGACCIDDACAIAFEVNCLADGGNYLGDGVDCDPDSCPDDAEPIDAVPGAPEAQTGTFLNGNAMSLMESDDDRARIESVLKNDQQRAVMLVTMESTAESASRIDLVVELSVAAAGNTTDIAVRDQVNDAWVTFDSFEASSDDTTRDIAITENAEDFLGSDGSIWIRVRSRQPDTVHKLRVDLMAGTITP